MQLTACRDSIRIARKSKMSSASDIERARTAMMVAAGVVTSTGLLVLTQRSIRSSLAYALKVRSSAGPWTRLRSLRADFFWRVNQSAGCSCALAVLFHPRSHASALDRTADMKIVGGADSPDSCGCCRRSGTARDLARDAPGQA